MEQLLDIGLNSKINEFAKKFSLSNTSESLSAVFEHFANYIVVSNAIEEEVENINALSAGQAEGIDGVAIIVNNRLVSEESDLQKIGENEKLKIEVVLIQATTNKSFDKHKFQSFVDSCVAFLTNQKRVEPFSTIYSKLFSDDNDYLDRFEDTPTLKVYFLSARTVHQLTSTEIEAEKNKITQRSDLENKFNLVGVHFLQKDEIKQNYDNIVKFHSVQIRCDKNVQLDQLGNIDFSLLATIKFLELKKIMLTKDGKLRERLFVENVRYYIGDTPVNNDIRRTLEDTNCAPYFPYLNNGITIMCDSIKKHQSRPDEFILTFPRIINGCQTTHILFEAYNASSQEIDNTDIVAKIIATTDNNLKKRIIFAANNQNSIDKDLVSLNDFHEKIETYFSGKEFAIPLYFERMRGQYPHVMPPYAKINIETLARVYIAVFLREPEKMKSKAKVEIDKYQKDKKIFHPTSNIEDYYYCAILHYWLNYFVINSEISLKSKTMDMHILLSCNLVLNKKNMVETKDKIAYLSSLENAKSIFSETTKLLNELGYLFDRRGFYSARKTKQLIESFADSGDPDKGLSP